MSISGVVLSTIHVGERPQEKTELINATFVLSARHSIGPFNLDLNSEQLVESRALTLGSFDVVDRKNFGTYTVTANNEALLGTVSLSGVTMEVDNT